MRRLLALVCILLGVAATPAGAHQLDEYLQATTIRLSRDHVALQLRLTPGVSVAAKVLAGIDTNGDEMISADEGRAYAERVGRDLKLTIDGRTAPLRLAAVSFSQPNTILAGLGDIELGFNAALPPGPPARTLTFENGHDRLIAVYLVNTLVPAGPAIHVASQDRSVDQSSYRLGFSTDGKVAAQSPGAAGLPVVATFFQHGVRHILTGYDHLLFVAALVLGATTLWDLVKVVTAFTIAHSITLTLATLGLVHLPENVVEPVIAASIVFVAVQNLVWPEQSRGVMRLVVAFVFGLFHGLGFAGGLLEVMHGMDAAVVSMAILGFSLGVEVGNQLVLLPLYFGLKLVRRAQEMGWVRAPFAGAVQKIGSAAISLAGACYFGIALTTSG